MRTLERKRTGEKGTHLSSARPVVTFVERDMSYPSAEGAIPIIAIERREAGDEGFLRQVHRLVGRSEEHTSELQSLMRISYAVFCLKKKKQQHYLIHTQHSKHQ